MAHEDLNRDQIAEGSSNRSFGFVFATVFLIIGVLPMFHGETLRLWAVGTAAIFSVLALFMPELLEYPNRLWIRLGILLSKVVSPIALGVVFYGALTPIGLAMRRIGKDPLRLKRDPGAKSYWISRDPPGPQPDSITNQF